MKQQLAQFWNDEEGATAIEYGLIAGLIAVVIMGALGLIGQDLNSLFEAIQTKLDEAVTAAGT